MWSALPPQSTMKRSDSPSSIRCPSFGWYTLPFRGRRWGLPGSWHLSYCVPRSLTPTGPLGSHHIDPFVLASDFVTPSPPAVMMITRLHRLREDGLPCGPQDSLCTLRIFRSFALHCILLISATLDTGGWLDLTRQGLAPCKKCRALLGATTFKWKRRSIPLRIRK